MYIYIYIYGNRGVPGRAVLRRWWRGDATLRGTKPLDQRLRSSADVASPPWSYIPEDGTHPTALAREINGCLHFSIYALRPCTGAMLIFSALFQFERMIHEGIPTANLEANGPADVRCIPARPTTRPTGSTSCSTAAVSLPRIALSWSKALFSGLALELEFEHSFLQLVCPTFTMPRTLCSQVGHSRRLPSQMCQVWLTGFHTSALPSFPAFLPAVAHCSSSHHMLQA